MIIRHPNIAISRWFFGGIREFNDTTWKTLLSQPSMKNWNFWEQTYLCLFDSSTSKLKHDYIWKGSSQRKICRNWRFIFQTEKLDKKSQFRLLLLMVVGMSQKCTMFIIAVVVCNISMSLIESSILLRTVSKMDSAPFKSATVGLLLLPSFLRIDQLIKTVFVKTYFSCL